MLKKLVIAVSLTSFVIPAVVLAGPGGPGGVHGGGLRGPFPNGNPAGRVSYPAGANVPPGVGKTGVPGGLLKQDKTPFGWSQGQARWKNSVVSEPVIQKMTPAQRNTRINDLENELNSNTRLTDDQKSNITQNLKNLKENLK